MEAFEKGYNNKSPIDFQVYFALIANNVSLKFLLVDQSTTKKTKTCAQWIATHSSVSFFCG
jgi:hypothetical protein